MLVWLGGCSTAQSAAESPPPDQVPTAVPSVIDPGEAAPTMTTLPVTMAASPPVRVRIPAIGVDSRLIRLGLEPNGELEVPLGAFPAGWYTGAPTPGELGPAVIAGHVRWNTTPGVFAGLTRLKPGDEVTVRRRDGSAAVFRVSRVARFDKATFPTSVVYGDIDHAGLRLITCGGLDKAQGRYDANVVVFADLVGLRGV